MAEFRRKKRLGEMLIDEGVITDEQFEQVMEIRKANPDSLYESP